MSKNTILCHSIGPRPSYQGGQWQINDPEYKLIAIPSESNSNLIDKNIDSIQQDCLTIAEHVNSGELPSVFSNYTKSDQISLRNQLAKMNKWRGKLNLESTANEFFQVQNQLEKDFTGLVSKTADFAKNKYAPGKDITNHVVSSNQINDPDDAACLKYAQVYHNILDKADSKDILSRSIKSIGKSSIWLVVGAAQPDLSETRVDTQERGPVKIKSRFPINCSIFHVPSVVDSKRNLDLSLLRTIQSNLDSAVEPTLRSFTSQTTSENVDAAKFNTDPDAEEEREEQQNEYVNAQYDQLRTTENDLVRILESALKEGMTTDNSVDINVVPSYQFHQQHPTRSRQNGFIDWDQVGDTLENEFKEITEHIIQNAVREKHGFKQEWTEEENSMFEDFKKRNNPHGLASQRTRGGSPTRWAMAEIQEI
ncbi:uncharacterized protein L201_002259 [Kwoniella dendrophila CBS 6074]|uniref:Uncharacterized protein n=1 Tax=Kwoniella dendrophila CBS 6074 TaxID=1295534 RepID=A0AAX4JPP9_9TREE